jgi:FtsZ-binding cell division protein ZapB
MSSTPRLLNSAPPTEKEILEVRIAELEEQLRQSEDDVQTAKNQAMLERRALTRLRHQLQPMYDSLRVLFGEMDAVGVVDEVPTTVRPEGSAKWEAWKHKLGGKAAEFITELLIHGEMTGQQLKVATKCGQQTVYDTIAKLNKAQLLQKNGGKYSLRES